MGSSTTQTSLVLQVVRKGHGHTVSELEDEFPTVSVRMVIASAERRGLVRVDLSAKRTKVYPAGDDFSAPADGAAVAAHA